jgi:hypothetical protein
MEIVVYFDSTLQNLQRLHCKQRPDCNPVTIAEAICPNYYAFSANGGETVKYNPDFVKEN